MRSSKNNNRQLNKSNKWICLTLLNNKFYPNMKKRKAFCQTKDLKNLQTVVLLRTARILNQKITIQRGNSPNLFEKQEKAINYSRRLSFSIIFR